MPLLHTIPIPSAFCLALLLAASFPSHANARSVRAMFLGALADSPQEATLVIPATDDGGEATRVTLDLPRRFLSTEVHVPDGRISAFVLPGPPAEGVLIDPSTPTVEFPAESKHSLLLFIPDPDNHAFPVRVILIDASPARFPEGHSLFVNLSGSSLVGQFGDQKILLEPGMRRVMGPPKTEAGGYPVLILSRDSPEHEWSTIASSTWAHNPTSRQLVFVTTSKGRQTPRVWSVVDRPQVRR